jgi:hypothetical protein
MKYEDERYMTSKQMAIIAMTKALTKAKIPHGIDANGHALVMWWDFETTEMVKAGSINHFRQQWVEDAPKSLDTAAEV